MDRIGFLLDMLKQVEAQEAIMKQAQEDARRAVAQRVRREAEARKQAEAQPQKVKPFLERVRVNSLDERPNIPVGAVAIGPFPENEEEAQELALREIMKHFKSVMNDEEEEEEDCYCEDCLCGEECEETSEDPIQEAFDQVSQDFFAQENKPRTEADVCGEIVRMYLMLQPETRAHVLNALKALI